jgi:cellulose biosynthesis protein BcsQ
MSGMAQQIAKAIFVGNIKGGVGKSTLSVYMAEYLRRRFKDQSVTLIDTDPQGTSFELMGSKSKNGETRFLPVGDRYDGVNMSTLDGVLRRLLAQNENMAIVDTGAGRLGSFWQLAFLCNTLLVPTSMSWADLRPTIEFIKEIDDRKADLRSVTPHVVVVPNRVSPHQRNFQPIRDALFEVNAILAPPLSELSAARSSTADFSGLDGIEGTRFHSEIERLGEFLVDYVFSGKLDQIYAEKAN